jgi:hypothetical protein
MYGDGMHIWIRALLASVLFSETDLSAQYNYFFCRPQLPCTNAQLNNDTGHVWYNFPDDDVESPILKQGVVESVTLDYG